MLIKMTPTEQLKNYVARYIDLSDDEFNTFSEPFRQKNVKKKQFIVQPDFYTRHRYFVVSGTLRAYFVDDSGDEHTMQFAIENWWISDFNAYLHQQPATLFIVALEDSVLLELEFDKEAQLKSHPKFNTFFRIMAERGLAFEHRRILWSRTLSAEQRYDKFAEDFPYFIFRVPQYMLASYLGMTTVFLSRIRNKKLGR
jgi:CRP-like cAMP-binding protein